MRCLTKIVFALVLITIGYGQTSNYKEIVAKKNFKLSQNAFNELNYQKSLLFAEKALNYALKVDDYVLAAKAYNIIGLNFEQISDVNKAIDFYEKGIDIVEKTKNDTVSGWLYNNIAGLYTFNHINLSKGRFYYQKALEKSTLINNKEEIIYGKLNLAINYFEDKKYQLGYNYLNQIKSNVDVGNLTEAKMTLYSLYGLFYSEFKNDYNAALVNYKRAENFAINNKKQYIKLNVVELYQNISNFYKKFNKDNHAFQYLKKHDELEDELFNESKLGFLNQEYKSINVGEINNRIVKVENENKDYIKKIKNNRIFIVFLILVILLTSYLLYSFFKNLRKTASINKKLKRTNKALKRAKLKTEEMARLKTQFMSTVSHELRTPLYGVIGITEILESEHPELKTSNYFEALKKSSNYLLSLINDILDVYKIEEGQVEILKEKVNLSKEINTISQSLHAMVAKNNNKIVIDIKENVPEFIISDRTRLSQILLNLISNSLKFTKDGIVTIIVENINVSYLKFHIKDTGCGIPEEYLGNIFDKFIQVNRNIDEPYQGTGLGLSIVKKTIELFGGTISIDSVVNKGTHVSFTIPLIENHATETEPLIDISTSTSVNDYFVLVAEDNQINQIVTKKLLDKHNIKSIIVNDGFEAIKAASENNFDLILMDINMPNLDGFQASLKIREFNATIPIIALTATDKHEIINELEKSKINDVLVKPFEINDLINSINKYVNKH